MTRKHEQAICEECTLIEASYVPTAFVSAPQYPILWVGQAPGEVETYTRVPFTGPAGKTHYGILRAVGMRKENMPHANIVNCWPPGDRKPTFKECMCCLPRLKLEIKAIEPRLIVALGEVAVHALTGLTGITSQRGRIADLLDAYEYKCKVLCSLHPSFVMRQRQWIPIQAQTYTIAMDFLKGRSPKDIKPTFIMDPSPEELSEYLSTTSIIACDTETTGLNHRKDEIIGFSFSKSTEDAVALKFVGPQDPRWNVIKEFMEDGTHKKIWQNGSFDTGMLRFSQHNPKAIIDRGFYYDTRLAEQLLHSDLPSDLDYLRAQYTNIRPYKPSKSRRARIASWTKEEMLEYAAWDAVTTLAVYEEQMKELTEGQLAVMTEHLIPLVYALNNMQNKGVLVDVNTLAGLYSQCAPAIEELERPFAKLGVNPRAPGQLKKLFGLRDTREDTLEHYIKRRHPQSDLMESLLEHRRLSKLASVYLKGVYKRLEEGRIHTTFKIEGTGTGRISSEDPNLQNIPEEMRIIYIPDPDCLFVGADYKQIELWIGGLLAAQVGKTDTLLQELQKGTDIHYISCQLCFPHVKLIHGNRKEDFEHWQELAAKTVTFGTFYGRTPHSIAREFGVTVAQAEDWQIKIINQYPELASYREWCQREIAKNGYLETPFGRRRYVDRDTQGFNFPVQSSAGDVTLGSIWRADQDDLDPRLTVHDNIIFNVPRKQLKFYVKKIKEIMERDIPELGMSFKADYTVGENWYEMEPI